MTKDIQKAICTHLAKRGYEYICENYNNNIFEMDVAAITKANMLHEFEIKISRSDFNRDKKKGRYGRNKFDRYSEEQKHLRSSHPNYFSYVCPEGMIKENEIPDFAGLWYFDKVSGLIGQIKKPKRIHPDSSDRAQMIGKMLRLHVQRKYLGGAMLTILNREAAERNKNRTAY